jgi:glycosyltransferase involved in cell wall biosynthesis
MYPTPSSTTVSTRWPKITIITPVLNAEATIEKTINSVLEQNYPALEYIIIDGGSTDSTLTHIAPYRALLTLITEYRDRGPTDAYNYALERATGDVIGMLSADDWLEPGILEAIARAFVDNPESDIVSCHARLQQYNSKKILETLSYWGERELVFDLKTAIKTPITNARFIKKTAFQRCGAFKPFDADGKYIIACDLEFILRLVLNGMRNTTINRLGYTFLAHHGSLTNSGSRQKTIHILHENLAIYSKFIERHREQPEVITVLQQAYTDDLLAIAYHQLRSGLLQSAAKTAYQCLHTGWYQLLRGVFNRVQIKYKQTKLNAG